MELEKMLLSSLTVYFVSKKLAKSRLPDECLKDLQLGEFKYNKKKRKQWNNHYLLIFVASHFKQCTFYG